jgi:hypothetical protein
MGGEVRGERGRKARWETGKRWSQHCKKRVAIFPTPAGMSLTKLSLAGNIRVWLVTYRLGTGKSLSFSYMKGRRKEVNGWGGGGGGEALLISQ